MLSGDYKRLHTEEVVQQPKPKPTPEASPISVQPSSSGGFQNFREASDGIQGTDNSETNTSIYNYSWEDADKFINDTLLGIPGHKFYESSQISSLPEEIIYKKGEYTYVYILDVYRPQFMGMELDPPDDIVKRDGRY